MRVVGLPDLTHAALAKEGGHVVVPEAGASGRGHGLLKPTIETFYAQARRFGKAPTAEEDMEAGVGAVGPSRVLVAHLAPSLP